MKYIILCGGIGKRCNQYSLPKPLNYVNGRHLIEYIIDSIPSNEINIIYINKSLSPFYNNPKEKKNQVYFQNDSNIKKWTRKLYFVIFYPTNHLGMVRRNSKIMKDGVIV